MRSRKRMAMTLLLGGVLAIAGVALAADNFTDVPDSHLFHDDIQWLAENNITKGCNPPANDEFCPQDSVTRGQMAAFLHRFADNVDGVAGPQGPQGAQGPQGDQGPPGPTGQTLVAEEITDEHPTLTDAEGDPIRVVEIEEVSSNFENSYPLFDAVSLPEGKHKVEGTVQFFSFDKDGADIQYGLSRVFLDGEPLGTTWTPDIPEDASNAAQGSGSLLVEVPSGGGTLTVEVAVRGAGDGAYAGGNLIVTQFGE